MLQMYPGWSARDNYAVHKKRRKRKVKQVDSKAEESADGNKESDPAESKLPQSVAPPTAPPLSKGSLSPVKTPPPQRMEDEDTGE